jgi:adenylate kinase family enzyme
VARFLILTGASGAGKTTLGAAFEEKHGDLATVFRFDRVGVPSEQEMVRLHGSPEAWQRDTMHAWTAKAATLLAGGRDVLLDGQVRRAFIVSACESAGIEDYRPVLIDCSDPVRQTRLMDDRSQPELANPDMMRWAALLRAEAIANGDLIIDTCVDSVSVAVDRLRQLLRA